MKLHADDLQVRRANPFQVILLSWLALHVSLVKCSGQGQVTFNNSGTTLISTNWVHDGAATGPIAAYPGSGPNQYVFALFVAPSTVTTVSGATDPNWTFTGCYATNTTAATGGRIAGGQPILPAPYATTTTWNFIIRGWSSTIAGQDWPTAQAVIHSFEANNALEAVDMFYGTSAIATITVGGAPSLPSAALFGTTPGTSIQGFVLNMVPIPEPSSFALAAVGLVLLCGRRLYRVRK
jgi:hypothetical protein